MESALYFPYIEVPESPSLSRVLLYWDTLSTIVPSSIPELGERTQELVDCGLVARVAPEDHLREIADFEDGFVALLEQVERQREATVSEQRGETPNSSRRGSRVHSDKVTGRIKQELEDRGFVRDRQYTSGGGEWLHVEGWVASLYMAYIACVIGNRLEVEPLTDMPSALAAIVDVDPMSAAPTLDKLRATALAEVLPAPSAAVSPRDLADFKLQHWDELRAFRIHVERELLACAKESDPELRNRCVRLAAQSLQADVEQLEDRMARRRWPTARGMLAVAFDSSLPAAQFAATHDPWSIGSALSPVVKTIVSSLLGREDKPEPGPLAYAALARRAFRPEPTA